MNDLRNINSSEMRESYLRVGGSDPITMSRLSELETRALDLRNARQRRQRSSDIRNRSSQAILPRNIGRCTQLPLVSCFNFQQIYNN